MTRIRSEISIPTIYNKVFTHTWYWVSDSLGFTCLISTQSFSNFIVENA